MDYSTENIINQLYDHKLAKGFQSSDVNFLAANKNFIKSRSKIVGLISRQQNSAHTFKELGTALFKQGKLYDAFYFYSKANTISPQDLETKLLLAETCYETSSYSRAIDFSQSCLTIDPMNLKSSQLLINSKQAKAKYVQQDKNYIDNFLTQKINTQSFIQDVSYSIPGDSLEHKRLNRFVDFSLRSPDGGINYDTGILLLLTGANTDINSERMQEHRRYFANAFNVLAISIKYMGHSHLNQLKANGFYTFMDDKNLYLSLNNFLEQSYKNEIIDNFIEGGFVAALDVLKVLGILFKWLNINTIPHNSKRVFAVGVCRGSHMARLCSAFAPNT